MLWIPPSPLQQKTQFVYKISCCLHRNEQRKKKEGSENKKKRNVKH